MEEKKNLKEVHGYTSNLLIELSKCGTGARIGGKKPRWQEIKYDQSGEPFITHYGLKILFNQVLRVEK